MRRRAGVIIVGLAIVISGCTGSSPPHKSSSCHDCRKTKRVYSGGMVSFGVLGSPVTLDPYSRAATDLTREVVAPLYLPLFRFEPDGSIKQVLARHVLRRGGNLDIDLVHTRWSNGQRVSADDVKATVDKARSSFGLGGASSVRVKSSHRVILRGVSKRVLASCSYVLPRGQAATSRGVFDGPFILRRWVKGRELEYKRNPKATKRTHLDGLTVYSIESVDEMMALLANKSLDAAEPPSAVNLPVRLDSLGLDHRGRLGWSSIQLDLSGVPERTARVGAAASVDRDLIAHALIRDGGRRADTLMPSPGSHGARGPFATITGGTAQDANIRLAAPVGDEQLDQIVRIVRQDVADAGANAEVGLVEPDAFYSTDLRRAGFDASLSRVAGIPGARSPRGAVRTMEVLPMFQVANYLAWRPYLRGLRVNPTITGSLYNTASWSRGDNP